MGAPCPQSRSFGYYPVTFGYGLAGRTNAENFKASFVSGDGGRLGSAKGGGEGRFCGIGALDLVYVRWVEGCR